jgi:flagellar hook-associated protein 2
MSSTSAINSLLSLTATNSNQALNLSSMLAAGSGASTPGIDVNAAVAAAIYADRAPERIWQADQATLSSQTNALTAIQNAVESLQNDMDSLNSLAGPFQARIVSSSNSNYVTASAAIGTQAGVHNVVVNSLATQASWYSDLESSPTVALPASSLTITTASGATATFATGTGNAGDNLNDLAAAINANSSLGVSATVISDSTGSRLAIISKSVGKANDFSITSENYTGLSWTSPEMPTGATLGANSVTISSANGASVTVASTSGETYAQLAADINSAISSYNAGNPAAPLNVTATAGSDANGTNLNLASNDGVTPFTINEPAFGFTQAAAATDASATIDGVPYDSASNTISGAIPGVTLNLLGTTQGAPVSLTVAPDAAQTSTAIDQFVTDYNSAINLVNAQFKLTGSTDSAGNTTASEGVLASDATVVNLQSTLEQALNYLYAPASGSTTVSSLRDLGITMNNDGTLSVNSATLANALVTSPGDVQNFFQGAALNGFASSVYGALNAFTAPGNGAFQVDLNSMSAQSRDLSSQISDFEANYIAAQQIVLTQEFSKAEQALQSLPQKLQQLNAELGFNNNSNHG